MKTYKKHAYYWHSAQAKAIEKTPHLYRDWNETALAEAEKKNNGKGLILIYLNFNSLNFNLQYNVML